MVDEPRWGWVDLILVYIASMLISLLYGWYIAPSLAQYLPGGEQGKILQFLLAFLMQFFCMVGFAYLFAVRLPRGSWSDLGLKPASWSVVLRYGIWGGLGITVLILLLSIPIQYLQPQLEPQYFESVLRSAENLPSILPILLVGTVLGPFSEELFYRGMIYPVLRHYTGPVWGAILAGLVFGLAHWDLWRTIPLAIGGAVLCYIYEKSGSIWVTTLAHGIWNGCMSIMVFSVLMSSSL